MKNIISKISFEELKVFIVKYLTLTNMSTLKNYGQNRISSIQLIYSGQNQKIIEIIYRKPKQKMYTPASNIVVFYNDKVTTNLPAPEKFVCKNVKTIEEDLTTLWVNTLSKKFGKHYSLEKSNNNDFII